MRKIFLNLTCLLSLLSLHARSAPISYTESGGPSGTPVVFIHAFPLNSRMWDDQVNYFKDYRVITFDIRGLGKSSSPFPYSLEFVVDDLISVLDKLKIERAVVCGLSMGGFVALRAVERNPERFKALILADTKSEPDSDSSKLGRYQAIKTIEQKGLEEFATTFIRSSLSPGPSSEETFQRALKIARTNTPAGVEAALLALTSRLDTTPGLSAITVPTLILHGEFDTVIPVTGAKSLNEKIKGSKLVTIPKAGHLSNLENPQAFNEAVGAFLKGLKP